MQVLKQAKRNNVRCVVLARNIEGGARGMQWKCHVTIEEGVVQRKCHVTKEEGGRLRALC